MEVKGYTGSVNFDGRFITIKRKGLLARMSVGKGDKRIPLRSISAIQWKPASFVANGYIEFSIGGGSEVRSKFGSATSSAVSNENAVVFTKSQMAKFVKLRKFIEEALANPSSAEANISSDNIPGLIKELKALYEQGVLTKQEYEAKRADLLRRI